MSLLGIKEESLLINWIKEKILKHVSTVTFGNKPPPQIGKQCPIPGVPSLDYCCRRKHRPREDEGRSLESDHSPLCRISNSWIAHKAKVLQRWFLGSIFLKLHELNLRIPQALLLMFVISPKGKGVSGGISKIIQLCSIDDVNLNSSWVPAPKAKVVLFNRYYCIKPSMT